MKQEPYMKATSPDGKIVLGIFKEDDYYLGFEGQAWHTHGDLLVPEYGPDPKSAAEDFFNSILKDQEVICISKQKDKDEEIYVTDAPEKETQFMLPGEILRLRLWSGREIGKHEKRDQPVGADNAAFAACLASDVRH